MDNQAARQRPKAYLRKGLRSRLPVLLPLIPQTAVLFSFSLQQCNTCSVGSEKLFP